MHATVLSMKFKAIHALKNSLHKQIIYNNR